jgi:adenylate kinase family enzyme
MRFMPATLPATLQRIAIVGSTGSGKTTLAKTLAQRLAIPHIELDSHFWEANWKPAPFEVFRARVEPSTAAPAWVTDGNYRQVRDLVWARATDLIWLDYPLPLIFWRLSHRTISGVFHHRMLWNKNRESLTTLFFSRDSLFLWAIKRQRLHRREYPVLLSSPEYNHLHAVRLHSPRETQRWLDTIPTTK